MTEREYDEDEVREILDLAVTLEETSQAALPGGRGLTLAQLQEIGREAGVDPRRIEDAARALELRGSAAPRRTSMGMPVAVGRMVSLPRPPTDHEWEMLVVELRETFGARGRVRSEGGIREWANGNLHACVEPTEGGWRLRLGTRKTGAVARNRVGALALALGAAALPVVTTSGDLFELLLPAGLGALALASNFLTLRPWAEERERQMDRIAARAAALLAPETPRIESDR